MDSLQNKPGQNFNYYKWYNWGGTDFRLEVDVNQGNVSVYVNFVSEETFQTNGI